MFNEVMKVVAGMGGLIALFLVITNAGPFSQITQSSASAAVNLTKTLQGR